MQEPGLNASHFTFSMFQTIDAKKGRAMTDVFQGRRKKGLIYDVRI